MDLLAEPNIYQSKNGDMAGFEALDASLDELNLNNALELYNQPLSFYLEKIHYNGKVRITGTDIGAVARAIVNQKITPAQIQDFLYKGRLNCYSILDIVDQLQAAGFKVIQKILNDFIYVVTAERIG